MNVVLVVYLVVLIVVWPRSAWLDGDSRRVRSASLVGEERGGMLDSRVLQRLLLEIAR